MMQWPMGGQGLQAEVVWWSVWRAPSRGFLPQQRQVQLRQEISVVVTEGEPPHLPWAPIGHCLILRKLTEWSRNIKGRKYYKLLIEESCLLIDQNTADESFCDNYILCYNSKTCSLFHVALPPPTFTHPPSGSNRSLASTLSHYTFLWPVARLKMVILQRGYKPAVAAH